MTAISQSLCNTLLDRYRFSTNYIAASDKANQGLVPFCAYD